MRQEFYDIAAVTENGDSAVVNIEGLRDVEVQVWGTWDTATMQVKASMDGTNYTNVGSALAADGFLSVGSSKGTRLKITMASAGEASSVQATICGWRDHA